MRITYFSIIFAVLMSGMDLSGQLRINEIDALNTTGASNPLTRQPGDWIEIYNGSSTSIQLGGYYLSDDLNSPVKWQFPQNASIPAGGFLVVWADGTVGLNQGLHTNFMLDVAGEMLQLRSPAGVLIDYLFYPRMYENVSYGNSEDGKRLFFRRPTPGGANDLATGYLVAEKVQFDPPAGVFPSGIQVSMLTGDEGATIRYTTDGSPPEIGDPVYTGPISVSSNLVIRARQWIAGSEPSDPSTSSYIISEGFTLPVISLATDPVNLWDDQTGIYVVGTNGVTGYCSDQPRNWNQPWERPMSMEYFDLQGVKQLQVDCGVKIHGGCSRQAPMKSLGIFARSEYGFSSMDYPFFREKDVDSFKGLILRNGGNDFQYSFIRDAVIQATVSPWMDLDYQAYEPVQVFINGDYWGIHNLREKVNEHWVTSNYGIPAKNLDFLKNYTEVFAGSTDGFEELTRFLQQRSLVSDDNYNYVASLVDVDSYTDYLITEMFFANRDWPGNNVKYWRDRVNSSKWRWILFDMEFSMGLYDFDPAIDMFEFSTAPNGPAWPNPSYSTLLIRRLLENEGYRKQFLQKYMIYLNTVLSSEHIIQVIDSLYFNLYDDFPAHIDRWNNPYSMNAWDSEVEELRLFATLRPDHVWENMSNFYSMPPRVILHIEPMDHTGEIVANGIRVPREGFTGSYTGGFDLNLDFRAIPGYRFSHWEVTPFEPTDTLLLHRNSVWRYNDSGIYPGDEWKEPSYDDSAWPEGAGELGYGDGNESTVLDFGPDDQNKHIAYYFRNSFEIKDTSGLGALHFSLVRDDGAVVYVNGTEILRDNMPGGEILPETFASDFAGGTDETTYFEFTIDSRVFQPGMNTIAVEVHQNSPTSSDISFDLELEAAKSSSSADMLVYQENPLILQPESGISIRGVSEIEQLEPSLFINEFMASNQGAYVDEYGNYGDWIEIYNAGNTEVNMAGIYFTDDLRQPAKWKIPPTDYQATTIPAAGYLVFFADGNPMLGPRHLDLKLSSSSETIGLSYPSGPNTVWLDSVRFGPQVPNISSGRFPDGSNSWIPMEKFTPGYSNVQTSISFQHQLTLEVSLFPNPAADHLNIRVRCPDGMPTEEMILHMYDLTGRQILQKRIPVAGAEYHERIDVTGLPGAVYLVVLETGQGTHTFKFVKTAL